LEKGRKALTRDFSHLLNVFHGVLLALKNNVQRGDVSPP